MWSESESQRPLGEAALITRYDYSRGNVCVCVVVVWVRFVWESWLTDFSGNVRLHACHVASVRESLLKNSGTVTSAKAAQSTKITPAFIARHPAGFLLDLFFFVFFFFISCADNNNNRKKRALSARCFHYHCSWRAAGCVFHGGCHCFSLSDNYFCAGILPPPDIVFPAIVFFYQAG